VSLVFLLPFLFLQFNFGPSAPIAYPIAKILDCVLGAGRHQTYKKAELKSFLQFHRTGEEPLRDEELVILNGVLELNTKEVERIMTPLRVGYCFVGSPRLFALLTDPI
jgi:CBS domain containing-hemolysin-like protein